MKGKKNNESEPSKNLLLRSFHVFFSLLLFHSVAGLSGGSNKFFPTNGNNNELENLYKYYKSTGQVN